MITIYEYPKCSTCKKAVKFLEDHQLAVEVIDIVKETPSAEQIKAWMANSSLPVRRFFNTSGMRYRALGLKDKVEGYTLEEASAILATDGMLLKRPILVKNDQFLLNGFKEDEYEGMLTAWKKNI